MKVISEWHMREFYICHLHLPLFLHSISGLITSNLYCHRENSFQYIYIYILYSFKDETLKTEVPCTGSYPQACKRSQTVCQKSRGLPRLYWTSQFFRRGKHLMADELCAIHVKYIKFKQHFTFYLIFICVLILNLI